MEVVFAVFPSLELVEDSLGEGTEALCTHKTGGMEQFTVRVDNLGFGFEPIVTPSTSNALQIHDSWHDVTVVTQSLTHSHSLP